MHAVIQKTFPPKVKKSTFSLKKKKTLAKQEKLKREIQHMTKSDNAK